jgi:hypothetical protein
MIGTDRRIERLMTPRRSRATRILGKRAVLNLLDGTIHDPDAERADEIATEFIERERIRAELETRARESEGDERERVMVRELGLMRQALTQAAEREAAAEKRAKLAEHREWALAALTGVSVVVAILAVILG